MLRSYKTIAQIAMPNLLPVRAPKQGILSVIFNNNLLPAGVGIKYKYMMMQVFAGLHPHQQHHHYMFPP